MFTREYDLMSDSGALTSHSKRQTDTRKTLIRKVRRAIISLPELPKRRITTKCEFW